MTPRLKQLVSWLTAHDRNQAWACRQLGISQAWLSLVLAGKRPCSPQLTAKVDAFLKQQKRRT